MHDLVSRRTFLFIFLLLLWPEKTLLLRLKFGIFNFPHKVNDLLQQSWETLAGEESSILASSGQNIVSYNASPSQHAYPNLVRRRRVASHLAPHVLFCFNEMPFLVILIFCREHAWDITSKILITSAPQINGTRCKRIAINKDSTLNQIVFILPTPKSNLE